MEIGMLFSVVGHAKTIGQLLGLIDSLDAKIDRLLKSELDSGLRFLEQAANSEAEFVFLLRDGRSSFNKAISLERGVRLAVAHLGLAVSHHLLGDKTNSQNSLDEILKLNPVQDYAVVKSTAMDLWTKKRHPAIGAADATWEYLVAPVVSNSPLGFLFTLFAGKAASRAAQVYVDKESPRKYWRQIVTDSLNLSPEAKCLPGCRIRLLNTSENRYPGWSHRPAIEPGA